MQYQDYAILIGITPAQPAAGEASRIAHDIAAVRDWMLDPGGGAIRPERLCCLAPEPRAAAWPGVRPLLARLNQVVAELEAEARARIAAGGSPRLGRRLYLYLSGEPCLPGRARPDAEAMTGAPRFASAWQAWAQGSGLFQEVALWFDCAAVAPLALGWREPLPALAAGAGPASIALAARGPLRPALVRPREAAGRAHGAFTWALLEGLRGAAADPSGRVTAASLGDWLRQAQAARLPAEPAATLAREPELVAADPALVLAEGMAPPHFPVRLRFPRAAWGHPARLWHGAPARLDPGLGLARAELSLTLPPGLYLVEVPGAGLRHGFAVTGPGSVALHETGPAVCAEAAGTLLPLGLEAPAPVAQLAVVDPHFALVRHGLGQVRTRLPFGLYQLRCRLGRSLVERVLLLDRAAPALALALAAPSAAPRLPPLPRVPGAEALLRLSGAGGAPVSVVDDNGLTVLDLRHEPAGEPLAQQVHALPAGQYFLRRQLGAAHFLEQSLVLPAGWALDLLVPAPAGVPELRMRRLGGGGNPLLADALGVALADRRRVLDPEVEEALLRQQGDPLVGILTGHLLLAEHEADPGRDLGALNRLVRRLREQLGPQHPDVQALALACPDPALRPDTPVQALPLYQRSWRLLVAASHDNRWLLPARLWERALARTAQAPFLAWSTDRVQRSALQLELAEATWGGVLAAPQAGNVVSFGRAVPRKSPRAVARRRARLLGVPASALDLLAELYQDCAAG